MKKFIMTGMLAASVCSVQVSLADDTKADSDTSHPGAYVKDSVITAKVKSKLASKHLATLAHIKVDTDNQGVVWLSGKAPTQDASDLAAALAKNIEGVTSVHNKIIVAE